MAVTALFTMVLRLSHVCWEAQLMLVYNIKAPDLASNFTDEYAKEIDLDLYY